MHFRRERLPQPGGHILGSGPWEVGRLGDHGALAVRSFFGLGLIGSALTPHSGWHTMPTRWDASERVRAPRGGRREGSSGDAEGIRGQVSEIWWSSRSFRNWLALISSTGGPSESFPTSSAK